MVWSIIITTDLVCGEVQCPKRCCWQAYEKGGAIIIKLILCMCCKNRRLNTCRPCSTAVVYPNPMFNLLGFIKATLFHLCWNNISQELELIKKENHRSMMVKSSRLKGVWGRMSAPQAISERSLRNFHFPPFSILRLAEDVKVQGFNYRSVRPAEIFVASKEC